MLSTLREHAELLRSYRTAILTTCGDDGHFHSRPMAMRHALQEETLWFASAEEAQKIRDLRHDPRCAVTFYDNAGNGSYVSMSGRGEVVTDRDTMRTVWDESWDLWFPDGPGQRDVVLIRVTPQHVEYMHPDRGRLEILYRLERLMGDRGAGPELEFE